MTTLILDAGTLSRLSNLSDVTEIRDESGQVLGYFHPLGKTAGNEAVHRSPFTDEELRERQRQRAGRPLSEVLANLRLGHDGVAS